METKTRAAAHRPVFVDASGRRRRRLRRISIAAVAMLGGYGCLLVVSFAGGPIPPDALFPVPGIPAAKAPASTEPAQAPESSGGPSSATSAPPTAPVGGNAGTHGNPSAPGHLRKTPSPTATS